MLGGGGIIMAKTWGCRCKEAVIKQVQGCTLDVCLVYCARVMLPAGLARRDGQHSTSVCVGNLVEPLLVSGDSQNGYGRVLLQHVLHRHPCNCLLQPSEVLCCCN